MICMAHNVTNLLILENDFPQSQGAVQLRWPLLHLHRLLQGFLQSQCIKSCTSYVPDAGWFTLVAIEKSFHPIPSRRVRDLAAWDLSPETDPTHVPLDRML